MSATINLVRRLGELGATPEMIAVALEAMEGVIEARRAGDRERKRRQREAMSRDFTGRHVTSATPSPQSEVPTSSPKTQNPQTPHPLPPKVPLSLVETEFEALWKAYPHRKGRSSKPKSLQAWRALPKADKPRLLEAIQRYAVEGYEPRADCGAKAFELWLRDQRYLDWLEEKTGPPEPRVMDEDFVARQRARIEAYAKQQQASGNGADHAP